MTERPITQADIDAAAHPFTPDPVTPPMGWLAFWLFVWLASVVAYAVEGIR